MNTYYPEGKRITNIENQEYLHSYTTLQEAAAEKKILEGRAIVCDNTHALVVDLVCMKGIIPREEGALGIREGTVRDIALISRVNRPVCFHITGFESSEEGTIAYLSRRSAQEECRKEYIEKLRPGDIIDAKVTHLENFGVFADIGCGIIALLPIDAISVSRIDHPRERFSSGMDIRVIIRSIEGDRITLSHKELLGTWIENADHFSPGETVAGVVRSVESYGIFVELAPNLAGLAEPKEGIQPGQQVSVYIKSILPSKMKIKLAIIDSFHYNYQPSLPEYRFTGNHMDRFVYSPPDCKKMIYSTFGE